MLDKHSQKGFSLFELIVVVSIVIILSLITFFTLASVRKYASDDQAKKLIDIFDEARQRALNQRKTMRVEINQTKKSVILIDEATGSVATDDSIIKSVPFYSLVTIGGTPSGVSAGPTASSPIPVADYSTSNYPLSSSEQKITLRFKPGGKVVDAGTDNIGTGSLVTGATIYVYSTQNGANGKPDIIRAVTLIGPSADSSVYKCTYSGNVCGNWTR